MLQRTMLRCCKGDRIQQGGGGSGKSLRGFAEFPLDCSAQRWVKSRVQVAPISAQSELPRVEQTTDYSGGLRLDARGAEGVAGLAP